jgi:hypothetical protein
MASYGAHMGQGMVPPQYRMPAHQQYTRRPFISNDVRLELAATDQITDPFIYQQPRQPYSNQGYMPNGAPGGHPNLQPAPGATPLLPNQGRILQSGPIRLLCIADVRGKMTWV